MPSGLGVSCCSGTRRCVLRGEDQGARISSHLQKRTISLGTPEAEESASSHTLGFAFQVHALLAGDLQRGEGVSRSRILPFLRLGFGGRVSLCAAETH